MTENKLTRKRGSIKASLTNFTKFIDLFKEREQVLSDVEAIQIRERLIRIENLILEFNEVQTEIEENTVLEHLDQQYTERESFEELFYFALAVARNIIAKYDNHASNEILSNASSKNSSSASNSGRDEGIGVKLPVIPLPKFQGSYEGWLEYRDIFESLIHKSDSLTDIQKFHYLRASLEGNAAQVIKSIEFTASSYTVAWEALCDRYNNKKLLIHNHIKALFSLETIQKESSHKIRKIIDDICKHLRSLEQLGQKTDNWDILLIFMTTSKLDNQTLREWEKYTAGNKDLPSLKDLKTFLTNRANLLETLEFKNNERYNKHRDIKPTYRNESRSFVSTGYSCNFCRKNHSIYTCDEFLNLSTTDRSDFALKARLCMNCLREGHSAKKCKIGPCKKCKEKHNSLLHPNQQLNKPTENQSNLIATPNHLVENSTVLSSGVVCQGAGQVFLSTVYIQVLDLNKKPHHVRALLDCGSQSSFIVSKTCERLGLNKEKANLSVYGISNNKSRVTDKCNVEIQSLYSNFKATISCFILPEITNVLPGYPVDVSSLVIPEYIQLADPSFNQPSPIDILIGADIFWNILGVNRISCGRNKPILQETELGWVVSGTMGSFSSNKVSCNVSTNQNLFNLLSKFWEIEEVEVNRLTQDEILCEKNFVETTTRDSSGRFIVTMPMKPATEQCLGESKSQAEKRFRSIERKLCNNETLRKDYIKFMNEYEELNHMTISPENAAQDKVEYYMPHHSVLRETSLTTKLRVVFDASAPSSNGVSLNDLQLVGPVLQDDLLAILLRFRKHAYVISADIAKMYRQVLITPNQRPLQKILWRSSPSDELKSYTLNTVTYGQASASYLSIRCLLELANECESTHPDLAKIIRYDFYVDDLLTGADTIEKAQYICKEVSQILKTGCFELRKWFSNNSEVLTGLNIPDITCGILEFAPDEKVKTLGLTWSCQNDQLEYHIDNISDNHRPSKRTILSLTARIFDPLGLLSPCTILAKIIMQKLWTEKTSWDEPLPDHIRLMWNKFKDDLPNLNKLSINRRVTLNNDNVSLHGFADASEQAYGACIYLRSIDNRGNIQVNLLCAKSKVAPIKTLSIPRLELCAALLLSRLTEKVIRSLGIKLNQCVLWSDSTITLAWIKTSPNILKFFVGNRVSEIQTLTSNCQWRYVPTFDNPADYVSRGVYPNHIANLQVWWQGPEWLYLSSSEWPQDQPIIESLKELKCNPVQCLSSTVPIEFPFENFSSFTRMQRVTAYLLRFKNNCFKCSSGRDLGPLLVCELNYSLKVLIKLSQGQSFPDEVSKLSNNQHLNSTSKLFGLNPFYDQEHCLRVGGRLKQSDFPFSKKYPIVLDSKHNFTKLLFAHEHKRLLHAGPQLLLSTIRDSYWPISGRNLARATVKRCVRCFRFNPKSIQPIMGNLPRERVMPSSPFQITGVDYAGPFLVRDRKGRGCKLEKCYVSLFICFSTKAVHLELVSSLSTSSFIQALRRFIARRGKPTKIYSDNGTNFVGAKRELARFLESNKASLSTTASSEQIDWQFIPPYSPHFGGLWEAGVKSFKYHLKRVLENAHLIYEEFATVLTQIEAILNSRPLCPLTSDPSDLCPLTPAHLLIGKTFVAAPDEDVAGININRLTRFQLTQQICQHFWQRWHKEYISELQQRVRWKSNKGQLLEGALVLIKEDHLLPSQWRLGRILQLHQGSDGVARVASIQTNNGIIKRNFQLICPLPLSD